MRLFSTLSNHSLISRYFFSRRTSPNHLTLWGKENNSVLLKEHHTIGSSSIPQHTNPQGTEWDAKYHSWPFFLKDHTRNIYPSQNLWSPPSSGQNSLCMKEEQSKHHAKKYPNLRWDCKSLLPHQFISFEVIKV